MLLHVHDDKNRTTGSIRLARAWPVHLMRVESHLVRVDRSSYKTFGTVRLRWAGMVRLRPSFFQFVLQPEGLADEKARSGTGREVQKYHILLTERAGTPCVLDRVRRVASLARDNAWRKRVRPHLRGSVQSHEPTRVGVSRRNR